MGGGPSDQQKKAASAQSALANQQAQQGNEMYARQNDIYGRIAPFAQERMDHGLSFFPALTDFTSGTNAQAFAPAKANMERRLSNYGSLPSGFASQMRSDFDANRARAFDQGLTQNLMANDQAKMQGAGMLVGQQQIADPMRYYGGASQGYNSVMNAPLASPGLGGMIGGMLGGATALAF